MRKTRVLQVIYSLNRGGVETWLMHTLRATDRARFQMDFLTFSGKPGDFDGEARQLGARLFSCPPVWRPVRHASGLRSILQRYGPYDVVHSHDPHWNGSILSIAKQLAVPMRIAHSHSDVAGSRPGGFARSLYLRWSIWKSKQCATHGLASSRLAAASYFGQRWSTDPRWRVFYLGEDLRPFSQLVNRARVREALGLHEDSIVIGHVGSFRDMQKNHSFLVDIAREVIRLRPSVQFVLVGEGALRPRIEGQVAQAGLTGHVVFTGVRSDVPQLMLGAMDLFLFPSLSEGLGLALVEAQAAGLPCVFSDVIPDEAVVVPALCRRIPLSAPATQWARVILDMLRAGRPISQDVALRTVLRSPFNIASSVAELVKLYSSAREDRPFSHRR